MLPEDLRSALVVTFGRVQLKLHAEKLLEAVKVWRLTGAWRPRTKAAAATAPVPRPETPVVTPAEPDSERRVISLMERRQKLARAAGDSVPAAGDRTARLRP